MATLLLIDDHPLVQVALEAAVSRSPIPLQLYAVSNEQQARNYLHNHQVDLIILDIGLPDSDGLQLLKQLKNRYPHQAVLIYSAQEEKMYLRMAETAGAAGYIVKRQPMAQLLAAILAVLGGQRAFPALDASDLPAGASLTSKEQQILALLARGLSNLQIAEQLHISNKTVSTHKKNILDKTGATSVLDLAAVWKAQQ
ncbi:response regulator transcription factor [Erwiniaceae bacterium BAC15a-03b]|uniref:Response regulator transcription factor n=1 Tax=Winslowiella arboricola TaxID=2978220 RepID=A0A9J6PQ43_9GAMM|nr:response regulator transcription factor [Winslowiella arboricola]MCU5774223.1 response regulator transcription factor [Winslowiella arboricola]MCU5776844.1 response regulator transcription factor [Winslowiella arboricola]